MFWCPCRALLCAAFLVLGISGGGLAQSPTGALSGRIVDPSGAALSGAIATAREAAKGRTYRSETGRGGEFWFLALPVGEYELSVSARSFSPVRRRVRVEVGRTVVVDLRMAVESQRDEVLVVAAAARIDPHSSAVGGSVSREEIERLPLNQRELFRLALLSEGVQPAAPGSELSRQNESGLNVHGGREASNNYLLDGVDNNDVYINRLVVSPPLDSIAEFRLHAANYSAELGRSGGAQVNVVSRSGTNLLHASFYEYLRNDALDSRNFFDPVGEARPKFQRNQFGTSLGGPLKRNKAFIFMGFEGTRIKDAVTRTARVPTAAELGGDFAGLGRPVIDPFTQAAFADARVPAVRLDPIAGELAKAWPRANRADLLQNLVTTPVGDGLTNQLYGRADFYVGERDALYFRYNLGHTRKLEPFGDGDTGIPGFGAFTLDRGQSFVASETHVFGPRTVLEARFGFNRLEREVTHQNAGNDVASALGIAGLSTDPRFTGFPAVRVAGFGPIGDETALPIVRDDKTYHLVANMTAVRGRHVFKTGGEARVVSVDGIQGLFGRGQLNFLGALTTYPLADFVLGLPTFTIQTTIDNPFRQRAHSLNAFVQDDWRATERLTVNVGLRYEWNQPAVDAEDRFSLFDLAAVELVRPGAGGLGRAGRPGDGNNFAPRLGLSWRPAEGWVVRGAYGVFFDLAVLEAASGLYFNPPFFELRVFAASPTRLLSLSEPFPQGAGFSPPASVNAIPPSFRTGYSQHWNAGFEKEIAGGVTVRASYVGTKGTKLLRRRDINQPAPGAGDIGERRPIAGFANVVLFESAASSIYHAATLRAERRFAKGLSFTAAATVSKSIDDGSAFLDSDGDQGFPQNSHDFGAERGLSSFDQRRRFVFTADYELPWRGVLGRNWRLLTITSFGSGRPFTPALSVDNSNTGNGGGIFGQDRPDAVGDPGVGGGAPERFFNTEAFAMPLSGTFGNAGRNVLRGPSAASLDLAVVRVFELADRARLEARLEAFNIANQANFELPSRFADQPTFGRITAAGAARQLQLGLRLTF